MVLSGMDISAPERTCLISSGNITPGRTSRTGDCDSERVSIAAQPANAACRTSRGDLNPVFTGCYAARIAVKQRNREAENGLMTAERKIDGHQLGSASPAGGCDGARLGASAVQ